MACSTPREFANRLFCSGEVVSVCTLCLREIVILFIHREIWGSLDGGKFRKVGKFGKIRRWEVGKLGSWEAGKMGSMGSREVGS